VPRGLTLRDWVRAGAAAGGTDPAGGARAAGGDGPGPGGWPQRRPTVDDLEYHLSTLFPPVRPRGHLELRMIDAQPGDGWIVPLAVCWALLSDARAGDAALAAVAPLWDGQPPGGNGATGTDHDGPWLRAARLGPADPVIAAASRECFAAAREALDRAGAARDITAAVDAFREAYVSKDRCPADDLLEEAQ
jgi:glutamate--cysteine ligase